MPDPAYDMSSSLPVLLDVTSSSFHNVPPHLPATLSVPIYTNRSTTVSPPVTPTVVTYTASGSAPPFSNITSVLANSSIPNGVCTGCIIAGYGPVTTSYTSGEFYNPWTSTVVTETIVTEYSTYMYNNTVETVVTEQRTANQTKTLTGTDGQLITRATPTFTVQPTPGVIFHLNAGPTYVIYNRLSGALDDYHEIYWPDEDVTQGYCSPTVTPLTSWQPASTATKSWSYFIETLTGKLPESTPSDQPVPLPSKLIEYLKQDPDIQRQFRGSDIATCSFSRPPESFLRPKPTGTNAPTAPAPSPFPIFLSPSTGTYLATSFESTSVHVTVRGCLRCQDTVTKDVADPTMSNKMADPTPANDPNPDQHNNAPSPSQPDKPADNTAKPTQGGENTSPSIPDVANTFIDDNPLLWTDGNPGATTTRSVTIGGVVFPVNTPKPTQAEPDSQNGENYNPVLPVIVIGSETLTQGQTKTINGVPVVVPTDGGGTRIVVDGSAVPFNPATTQGLPVLMVGGGTVPANSQGEYVLGTETLEPGGPAIVINGNTVSMAPNGMAIVNGATQTIANVPVPTGAPAITVGSQAVSATVVGGSTVFVVAPGQTLSAGSTLVVDGTTYSMPTGGQGSTIVINGQTSSLSDGQSVITLDAGRSITAQIVSGTTVYVLAPDQTLTPGGVLTVSGTTYSMPSSASGSVVIINGATSTLAAGSGITAAPALTINGVTYTHTIRDGTTEYVLNDGTSLAPGSSVEIDGTTYSLDSQGTALIINGQTSTIPKLPKSNSASTTRPASSSTTRSASSSTTRSRDAGDLIASGIGETSKAVGVSTHVGGLDKWVESLVVGVAGWLALLL
ncbi:hypothetical protein G6011_07851 [Alternaria panax]|uniref:Uncharacterized protein n=1 Tax=Alternaria panax TaxID=48097 RepID=A0AAD4I4S8_9PLEO|nr:hypothetical protein G6011_07851 [Alternaria panax]